MGVHDDPAGLGLPEDPCQAHHRKTAGINDVPQDISRAYTRQLVDIPDQDQGHRIRNCLEKIIHEHDVDHGTLIHDQDIPPEGILFVFLITFRRLGFQQPVDGFGLDSRRLGETLCRPSGRSSQEDPGAGFTESRDHPQRRRRFSRARPAGKDQHLAGHSSQDRLHLDLVILHPCFFPDAVRKPLRIHLDLAAPDPDLVQAPRRTRF